MANYPGSVPVTGYIAPTSTDDSYAVTYEEFNRGGYRSVDTFSDIKDIPDERLKEGMLIFVIDEDKFYQYKNNVFKESNFNNNIKSNPTLEIDDIIDDSITDTDKTFSSSKILDEISNAVAAITGLQLYTDNKIIIVSSKNNTDTDDIIKNYTSVGNYYFGINAIDTLEIFNVKDDGSGTNIVDESAIDLIPDKSVAILETRITKSGIEKNKVFGLLIKDTKIKYIELVAEKNAPAPSTQPSLISNSIIDDTVISTDKVYSSDKTEDLVNTLNNTIQTIISAHDTRIKDLENKDITVKIDESMMFKDSDGVIGVKTASATNLGVIKIDNDTITIASDIISTKKYTGDNTTIDVANNGEISLSQDILNDLATIQGQLAGTIPPNALVYATATRHGIVRPDNKTVTVDINGTLSAKNLVDKATTGQIGVVKPDGNTIAVSGDGTISVKNPVNKIGQLLDVDVTNMATKPGQVLTVNANGTGFEIKKAGESVNRNFHKVVNSTSYELVYDFSQHINTAISATLEVKNNDPSNIANLRFVGRSSGEIVEDVEVTYSMIIPGREFPIKLYAKGNVDVNIDILSFI